MIREITVLCPECEQEDTTNVELEDYTTEYFITTECVHCTHPYVIGVTLRVDFRVGRIVMESNK